jgi:hypothetical protein
MLLSRSEDSSLDFDSSPVVIVSAEQAKHVGDEENQQYCPQPYAGPAARTPSGYGRSTPHRGQKPILG